MIIDALIGVDWGSSHLRGYRFDAIGQLLETRVRPWGVRNLPDGGFATALDQLLSGWPVLPMIACGMVGGRHGWVEVPYCELPADGAELALALGHIDVPGRGHLLIVPGLHTAAGPEVMRGEETQVFGALAAHPSLKEAACIVLPGTHSKWVTVQGGRVRAFRTVMTGELYALLRQYSVLAAGISVADGGAQIFHPEAFVRGVECARDSGPAGVLSRLFSARTLWLDDLLPPDAIADYLSGMLIGEELRIAGHDPQCLTSPLCLVGEPTLCARYVLAIEVVGGALPQVVEHASARGLWAIAAQAGCLTPAVRHDPHQGGIA